MTAMACARAGVRPESCGRSPPKRSHNPGRSSEHGGGSGRNKKIATTAKAVQPTSTPIAMTRRRGLVFIATPSRLRGGQERYRAFARGATSPMRFLCIHSAGDGYISAGGIRANGRSIRAEGGTDHGFPAVLTTHGNVVLGSKRFQSDLNISGTKCTRWSYALASIGNELGYASTCEGRTCPSMIGPTGVFR